MNGYTVWGGPPVIGTIDGTIVPCATAGSLPFLSSDCIAVLRKIWSDYPEVWQRYGFLDAFNPLTGWYDPDVVGINVGITTLMAERPPQRFRLEYIHDLSRSTERFFGCGTRLIPFALIAPANRNQP